MKAFCLTFHPAVYWVKLKKRGFPLFKITLIFEAPDNFREVHIFDI